MSDLFHEIYGETKESKDQVKLKSKREEEDRLIERLFSTRDGIDFLKVMRRLCGIETSSALFNKADGYNCSKDVLVYREAQRDLFKYIKSRLSNQTRMELENGE